MDHYGWVALCKANSIQKDGFCAASLASCSPATKEIRLSVIILSQVDHDYLAGVISFFFSNIITAYVNKLSNAVYPYACDFRSMCLRVWNLSQILLVSCDTIRELEKNFTLPPIKSMMRGCVWLVINCSSSSCYHLNLQSLTSTKTNVQHIYYRWW